MQCMQALGARKGALGTDQPALVSGGIGYALCCMYGGNRYITGPSVVSRVPSSEKGRRHFHSRWTMSDTIDECGKRRFFCAAAMLMRRPGSWVMSSFPVSPHRTIARYGWSMRFSPLLTDERGGDSEGRRKRFCLKFVSFHLVSSDVGIEL